MKLILGIVILSFSNYAYSSDPTGLFVLFVGIPFIVIAAIFSAICIKMPKFGAVLLSLLLIAHIPILAWASNVGYMDTAGGWLSLSFLMNIAGLFYCFNKLGITKNINP